APAKPIAALRAYDDIVSQQPASRRDQLVALGVLAGIALFLAAIGIHGLLSFTVSSRTQELGVRMALGAGRGQILGMVLRQGLLLSAVGIAAAIPLAYAAGQGVRAVLFGPAPAGS